MYFSQNEYNIQGEGGDADKEKQKIIFEYKRRKGFDFKIKENGEERKYKRTEIQLHNYIFPRRNTISKEMGVRQTRKRIEKEKQKIYLNMKRREGFYFEKK